MDSRRVEEILIINCHLPIVVSGDHTGTSLRQSIINSQLMDSRLRGNDISCLQSLIYFVIPVQTGI